MPASMTRMAWPRRRPAGVCRDDARIARDGREQLRSRLSGERAGRHEARHRRRDALVAGVELILERVQRRVVENRPPLTATGRVAWLRRLPRVGAGGDFSAQLSVRGRSLHNGTHVLRAGDAAGRRNGSCRHERHESNLAEPKWTQPCAPSALAGAERTDRKKLVRSSTFFWNSSRER